MLRFIVDRVAEGGFSTRETLKSRSGTSNSSVSAGGRPVNDRDWSNERLGSRVGLPHLAEIIELFATLFHPASATKQISCVMKPFPAFVQTSGNSGWLSS
jgi:hypothetical protein